MVRRYDMHVLKINHFVLIALVIMIVLSCSTSIHHGALQGNLEAVKASIRTGVNPDTPCPYNDLDSNIAQGDTPLMIAVKHNQLDVVQELIRSGANVNMKNTLRKETALHMANNLDIAKEIVNAKGDIHAKNHIGYTPLLEQASRGNIDIALFLIQAGANANDRSEKNLTALHWAVSSYYPATVKNSQEAREAYKKKKINLIRTLLKAGVDVNASGESGGVLEMPIHWASASEPEYIELLVKHGADINAKAFMGETPLHYAIKHEQIICLKKLIELKADIERKNSQGATPLHYAAIKGNTNAVMMLIKAGADPRAKNEDGNTPLDLALKNKRSAVADFLTILKMKQ